MATSASDDRFVKVVVSDLRGYLDEPYSERMTKYALASILQSAAFLCMTVQRELSKTMETVGYDLNGLDGTSACV